MIRVWTCGHLLGTLCLKCTTRVAIHLNLIGISVSDFIESLKRRYPIPINKSHRGLPNVML